MATPTPTSGGSRWGCPPFHPHLWGMTSGATQHLVAGPSAHQERTGDVADGWAGRHAPPEGPQADGATSPQHPSSEGTGSCTSKALDAAGAPACVSRAAFELIRHDNPCIVDRCR